MAKKLDSQVNVEPCLSDLEMLAIARMSYEAVLALGKCSMMSFDKPAWDSLPFGDKSAMACGVMNVHRQIVNPDDSTPSGVCFYSDSHVSFSVIDQRVFTETAKVFINEFRRKRSQYVFGNNGCDATFKELV